MVGAIELGPHSLSHVCVGSHVYNSMYCRQSPQPDVCYDVSMEVVVEETAEVHIIIGMTLLLLRALESRNN